MSCPFIDSESYNYIDCYKSDDNHVRCPLENVCGDGTKIGQVVLDYCYTALQTHNDAMEIKRKVDIDNE